MKKINLLKAGSVLIALMAGVYMGCQPEEFGDGNGLSIASLDASFEVTPIEGLSNRYIFKADEKDVLGVRWDLGVGAGFQKGKTLDTLFFPDAGKYTIKMVAIGRGGVTDTIAHDLTVPVSDPVSGNLVVGGKMDAGDDSNWTLLSYGDGVDWNMANGKMTATGGSWGHKGIYQAIQVEANKKYKVDMIASGKGATDTWFEVYVGTAVPQSGGGNDYNSGGKRLSLNTWTGCGKTPFSDKLTVLSCDPAKADGIVKFDVSGTVYLVIRTGGANLGDGGISIDNVEFRGVK